jgi:Sec-independent protein translocase protein TatA
MYRYIFLGALAACGILFVITAILFFTLRIPKVISDLSGHTARKAIQDIRRQNEQTGDKSYQSSAVNLERGKLTDKISKSGRLIPRNSSPFGTGVITEKISTQQLDEPAGETAVLSSDNETTVLSGGNESTVLNHSVGETAQLAPAYQPAEPVQETYAPAQQVFTIEYEITYIHTDEVIV